MAPRTSPDPSPARTSGSGDRPAESPVRYLTAALYAFAVFGWELIVVLLLDPLWRGARPGVGTALHWAVTAAGWATGSIVLLRLVRDPRRGYPRAFAGDLSGRRVARAAGIIAAAVIAVGVRALIFQEWKLVGEYGRLAVEAPDVAPAAFALLLAYYASETVVVVLVLALGQAAGELRFGRPAVPWGGVVLAATWGVAHILLQGPAAGLYAMAAALLYGCIFSLGHRRVRSTALLVGLAFVL